ncbi:MAG: imidazole glycerol phosphate synthase subunit HisH, partial [Clostridia bacterium]|nr:imidazole glycerol phosphate synthase subunit HisH [Clostridia bacterium]
MVAIVDYGVGNLFSLKCSLDYIGANAVVTSDAAVLDAADAVILPGVGAFRDAAEKLQAGGLDRAVIRNAAGGKPLLGICLGMQMLFDKSYEYGEYAGLGLIPGEIVPLRGYVPDNLKIPQIGWNALRFT